MAKKDPRVDDYIKNSAPFAQAILRHFRNLVHENCPEVEEKIKWSFPHFDYKGPMCHMASFKHHCAVGFWKAALMKDSKTLTTTAKSEVAMGHFGKITSLKELPKDNLLKKYIKEAMKINEAGIKLPAKKVAVKKDLDVPDYFLKALAKNKKALKVFEAYSYSHKKEYLEWITDAKTEATRNKRMAEAVKWLSEGKPRHWKYL